MEHLLIYLQGLAAIIGIIAYWAIFTYVRFKVFNDKSNNPFDVIFMPFISVAAVALILFIPYLVGAEMMR